MSGATSLGRVWTRRTKWVTAGVLAAGALLALPALFIAYRSYREEVAVFFPPRRPVAVPAAAAGVPGLADVVFPSAIGPIHGFYVPSSNRAAVILLHGAGGDRSSLLPELRALVGRGYGVLAFDLPGHGESAGEIHWSEGERASLRAAVDWLAKRDDVDPSRIGGYGFSLGGYVLAQVAAEDERLAAIVLAGTPADPVEQVRFQHRRFWLLSQLPALFVLSRGGMDLSVRARDFVGKLAPRPVFIVQGTDDATVPGAMGPELYAAAKEPKELYVIEGAGHGGYTAWPEYERRLTAFFDRYLQAMK